MFTGLSAKTIYSSKLTKDSGAPINLNKNSIAFLAPLLFHNHATFKINLLYNSMSISSKLRLVDVPLINPPPLLGKTFFSIFASVKKSNSPNPNILAKSLTKLSGVLFFLS